MNTKYYGCAESDEVRERRFVDRRVTVATAVLEGLGLLAILTALVVLFSFA